MPVSIRAVGSWSAALLVLVFAVSCTDGGVSASFSLSCTAGASWARSDEASADESGGGSVVIVGRIVTMNDPRTAEALLIEDGRVACLGAGHAG